MTNAELYRQSLSALTPGEDWRERTLAAMESAAPRSSRRRTLPILAACAALAIAAGLIWRWFSGPTPRTFPGGTVSQDPGYTSAQTLEKIAWSAPVGMGMGGSDDTRGFFMVHDLEEMTGVNPTLDNTDRIKELPVYKNPIPGEEEQLRFAQAVAAALGTEITDYESSGPETGSPYRFFSADMADGGDMTMENLNSCYILLPKKYIPSRQIWLPERLPLPAWADTLEKAAPLLWEQLAPLAGFDSPALEVTTHYNIYGEQSQNFFWFRHDPEDSLTDQLLDYCFNRIGDTFWHESDGGMSAFHLPCWPTEEGVLYPIRTAEEAVADFRAGDYLGMDAPTDGENAQILHVELVYLNQSYQSYIQPAYRITYTQDYWDETKTMAKAPDPESFSSVSVAYVPAVVDEYLEELDVQYMPNT